MHVSCSLVASKNVALQKKKKTNGDALSGDSISLVDNISLTGYLSPAEEALSVFNERKSL